MSSKDSLGDRMSKSNKIAFLVVIAIITAIAMFCGGQAITLPPPSNGAPICLLFVSGIVLGLYMGILASK